MRIDPQQVPDQTGSLYPEAFRAVVAGRIRKRLGEAAGLKNFGVNWVRLLPGSQSALRHWHTHQDELIYVLAGELTLVTNAGSQILKPGMAAGFRAGDPDGHHLVNHTDQEAIYLEIGDRTPNDQVFYPDDDLMAKAEGSRRVMCHKNGDPY